MRYLLDTHVLVWRFVESHHMSKTLRPLFLKEENEFLIPTVSLLEMQYLIEVGRIEVDMDQVLAALQEEPAFQLVPYDEGVLLHSLRLTTTRDPFDRIILAHALATSTKIITQDHWMKQTAPHLVVTA